MIGELLGPYRILEMLGVGGMGEVYLAEDTRLGRRVAIKVLPVEFASDPERLGRFEQEARSAAALNHPNICTLYDIGEQNGRHYIALELLQGSTLADRIAAGPCTAEEVVSVALQLAEGLTAAQEQDIIHRDLKPANVFVGERGQAKILDFGLATQRTEMTEEGETRANLTAAGSILGTMGYMSPEQALGRPVDARTDLFSFGVIVYEMATGKHPFQRDSHPATLDSLLHDTPESVRQLNPQMPPDLDLIIEKCLEKHADNRYPTATALSGDLRRLAGHSESGTSWLPMSGSTRTSATGLARSSSTSIGIGRSVPSQAPRPRAWAAAAIGVVAVVLASWWWLGGQAEDASDAGLPFSADPVALRQSLAVFEFDLGDLGDEAAWISPALAELIAAELSAGGDLRVVAGESVVLAAAELGIGGIESFDDLDLATLRSRLGVDAIVLGDLKTDAGGTGVRLDVEVLTTSPPRRAATFSHRGAVDEISALATSTAEQLRSALNVRAPSDDDLDQARRTLPDRPAPLRSYARGLAATRAYDFESARTFFEASLADDGEAPMVRLALAQTMASLGFSAGAVDNSSSAVAGSEVLAETSRLAIAGAHHELAARYEEAAASYRLLVGLEPDDVEHWLKLIGALIESDQFEDANAAVARASNLPEPASSDVRLIIAGAHAAEASSEYNATLEQGRAIVERARAQGSELFTAWGHFYEGTGLDRVGQPRAGARAIESAIQIFEKVGSKPGAAAAHSRMATIAFEAGDFSAARDQFVQVAGIQREIGDRRGLASTLNNIAATHSNEGDLREQRPLLSEALEIAHQIGAMSQEGLLTMNLARLAFRQGEVAQARVTARAALDLCRSVDYPYGEYFTLQLLGELELAAGNPDAASGRLQAALSLAREKGDRWAVSMILTTSGDVVWATGDLDQAQTRHLEALEIREQIGSVVEAAESRVALALIAADLGAADSGLEDVTSAIELFATKGFIHRETAARTARTSLLLELGDVARASAEAATNEALLDDVQYYAVGQEARTHLARVQAARGDEASATATLDGVIDSARQRGFVILELEARLYRALIEPDADRARKALTDVAAAAADKNLRRLEARATAAGGARLP